MKLARLIAGVDDFSGDTIKIIPRLPQGWKGYCLKGWPVRTKGGTVRADFSFEEVKTCVWILRISVNKDKAIPHLMVRFPDGSRIERLNVTGECVLQQPLTV